MSPGSAETVQADSGRSSTSAISLVAARSGGRVRLEIQRSRSDDANGHGWRSRRRFASCEHGSSSTFPSTSGPSEVHVMPDDQPLLLARESLEQPRRLSVPSDSPGHRLERAESAVPGPDQQHAGSRASQLLAVQQVHGGRSPRGLQPGPQHASVSRWPGARSGARWIGPHRDHVSMVVLPLTPNSR